MTDILEIDPPILAAQPFRKPRACSMNVCFLPLSVKRGPMT
jgi:hypothetical protein